MLLINNKEEARKADLSNYKITRVFSNKSVKELLIRELKTAK
nr:MAG TPA: hypothetical protein [Caudoviricetes sp.]